MANTKNRLTHSIYCIEITTTQYCNFRCSYCFENNTEINHSKNLEHDFNLLVKRIDEFLESEWFNKEFDSLELAFWGGEPTINYKMIDKILDRYADNPKTNFFMYSNGAFPKRLLDYVNRLKDKKHQNPKIKKYRFQVSYDGNPIHDLSRKTISGKPTSEIVKDSIRQLVEAGEEIIVKGTCPLEYVKYIPKSWLEMKSLNEKYDGMVGYALTVDYHEVVAKETLLELEKALIQVAKYEREYHRKYGKFLSNIFSENRLFCSSGKTMVSIDVDGKVYFCHGAIYHEECEKEMQYTSIYDNDFVEKLKEKYYTIPLSEESEVCKECISTMCLRCNVMKYICSKKETLSEKFNDWTSQPDQCEFYKMLGRITRALYYTIKEDQNALHRM